MKFDLLPRRLCFSEAGVLFRTAVESLEGGATEMPVGDLDLDLDLDFDLDGLLSRDD